MTCSPNRHHLPLDTIMRTGWIPRFALLLFLMAIVAGQAEASSAPPRLIDLTFSADDDLVEIVVSLDRRVEVRTIPASRGAIAYDFPGVRLPGGNRRNTDLESILAYSVNMSQLRGGMRVVINRKQFIPDEGTHLAASWEPDHPATYRIRLESRLSRLHPPKTGVTTVLVDAGHGGMDPGNLGQGIHEKVVTLQVAKRLARLINATPGWRALMTRTADVYVPVGDRPKLGRIWNVDALISLHANGYDGPATVNGFEIFRLSQAGYDAIRPRLSPSRQRHFAEVMTDSFRLAESVRDAMNEGTGLRDRGVKRAEMIVTMTAGFPSILVEMGFLTDKEEAAKLTDPIFQETMAQSILQGLLLYKERREEGWTGPARPLRSPRRRPAIARARVAPPGNGHRIAPGETLEGISRRYGISIHDLVAANRIPDPNRIAAGHLLHIPSSSAASSSSETDQQRVRHTIRRGETLEGLARRYGVPLARIVELNGIASPDRIRAGQIITIPVPLREGD